MTNKFVMLSLVHYSRLPELIVMQKHWKLIKYSLVSDRLVCISVVILGLQDVTAEDICAVSHQVDTSYILFQALSSNIFYTFKHLINVIKGIIRLKNCFTPH